MLFKKSLVLETIYDPDHVGRGPATLDLVLVHGLNGDRIKTWMHEGSKVFWPRDLLPKQQPLTRVLSFGFNADIYGNTSTAGIRGNARALLSRLCDEREDLDGSDNGRPIVFVAHSLGGLIVKQALRFANNEPNYQSIAGATRGLLLYGTPHAGSDRDRWLSIAKGLGGLMPIWKGGASALVEAMTSNSSDIADICEDFRHLSCRYAIVSFYETRAWPGTGKPIVDKMSSLMHLDHEDQVPLEANHVELCRFESEDDEGFKRTVKRITRAARGMPNPMQTNRWGGQVVNQYVWVNAGGRKQG
ncbi:DUF676 domain-containing protein (Fragment) [Madurella fahalii]|uniref:DUF676 domain-containing protein n=1 Tax=Madurella fahalii TaxID=1157608 RepID=A0ABQ0GFJ9_9PEZI